MRISGSTDVISFLVSQDAFRGDAKFVVRLDGNQVGPEQIVPSSAVHADNVWESVEIDMCVGAETHTLDIEFVNDAWGGSGSGDRNLYVKDAAINGVPMKSTTTGNLYYPNQVASFVTQPVTPPPEPPVQTKKLTSFVFVYRESEDEVFRGERNKTKEWGFDAVAIDALSDKRSLRELMDLIHSKWGQKVIVRLTRGGPDVAACSEGDFSAYGSLMAGVSDHPALAAVAISDECDNSVGEGNIRLNNYKKLVDVVHKNAPGIPVINISNGKYSIGDAESIAFLGAGDDVIMFSAATGSAAGRIATKTLEMTSKRVGVFIPSWRSPKYGTPAAAVDDIVGVALSLKSIGDRAAFIGAWAYKSVSGFEDFIGIADDPVIEERVIEAMKKINAAP